MGNSYNGDVVISGAGVVSSLGSDINTFWDNCIDGKTVVKPIPEKWLNYSEFNSTIWSPLPELDFKAMGFSRVEQMQFDPVAMLAIHATQQALEHAGLNPISLNNRKNQLYIPDISAERIGVFVGTGIGGAKTFLENQSFQVLNQFAKEAQGYEQPASFQHLTYPKKINPFVVSMLMPNAVSASVGIKFSVTGVNRTISHACASGTSAIGQAYKAIQSGQIDLAICGGAEYLYDDYGAIFRGFDVAKTLTTNTEHGIDKANRPFDQNRSGFLYAQGGAGIVILEKEHDVEKRNVTPLAKITGFAETFDAHSMMHIDESGTQIKRMFNNTLQSANIEAEDIDYINTHGTGTELNDKIESQILSEMFNNRPLINSSKSLLGHTIGASGALETIITALSLKHQTIHPSHNLENPIADLSFVTQKNQTTNIQHALTQSFAFGGHNACLALSKGTSD